MKYLPDACPECGFIWGSFQGRKYGHGYEELGAHVWKCTRCNHIVRSANPAEKRIARV